MIHQSMQGLATAVVLALVACSPEAAGPPQPDDAVTPGQSSEPSLSVNRAVTGKTVSVFLKYGAAAPGDRVARVMAEGAEFANDVRSMRTIAIDVPRGRAEALRRLPWVVESEVDSTVAFPIAEVLPRGVDVINAELVHARGNRGTGVRVAFLDGGVRCTNADLIGRIKGGYDFVLGNSNYCTGSVPQRDDGSVDHGTAVAQIIGGAINGSYFYGVAPEADLYSLRVCTGDPDEGCTSARIYSALLWARDNNMQVVSASIGNCGQGIGTNMELAMLSVYSNGIPQAWGAGNGPHSSLNCNSTDPVSGYARQGTAIAVSAFNATSGAAKSGYQYGPEIDISAPTDVQYLNIFGDASGSFGGTSGATPHVAGTLALLIKARFSGVDLLTRRLTETATDAGAAGKDNIYGYGKLNADRAVAPLPSVTNISGPATPITVTNRSYTLTATVGNGLPPYSVKWDVTWSNGSHAPVSTGYGSASYSMPVPDGSYKITVTATPRENTYLRVGNARTQVWTVCTGGGGGVDPLVASHGGGGGIVPTAVGGC